MTNKQNTTDVILIGAGVMSATLGILLKELVPDWNIKVFEKLSNAGEESSNEWNNAGTGHAALCELNYTSENPDGSVDISKAIKINEQFQVSMQFWSYLVNHNLIQNPEDFIRLLPHMSLVQEQQNVDFLKRRFKALSENPLFKGMEFSDDAKKLMEWIPLIMKDRPADEVIAATKIDSGTDVNFGALTRKMFDRLEKQSVEINYNHSVTNINRTSDGLWELKVRNHENGSLDHHKAKFVFIGGGGGSLHLLQKSGIPEGKHIGGFPVSGIFMVCNNPDVAEQHHAKVYGKAKVGAPPMSVPHLDTRFIDNKKMLLFGPFAGFSPKFLKYGSVFDLLTSVKPDNLVTMLAAGAKNMSLTKYLIQQVMLTKEQRMEELREFIPNAKSEDWELVVAGQRVQVIKDTEAEGKGALQFGTEVISAKDGSIAALLGASPGASTAVHVMLEVIQKCFPQHIKEWEPKIKEMIPSYGVSLMDNPELLEEIHASTAESLGLNDNNQTDSKRNSRFLKQA
ncbi:malate:quinone oxidoreductase [Alkalihalobacillus alcalophilus ATCC 27647 = CGMCC 1.3604]|uniref:Probable malate:quinone oxidoreductase n=1 Tax=Alkalihalobacillus alcalophilus ATCC 27647 = CGMCC 1.3604 TaxID=1218173 RepID=A0A094WIA2_ALKAL|nr:malate:quinone oxidoreductase [Alkalihalobacillus alcalophilus]KGA97519.1 malate:quinone oxidoreductase [Alkalihalobacillus alcalophilus ATCC 27647 = CGMCC 1.3604]MED1560770.1 malate:quinone oxidoreductase [Alkalihalobacillus alcalophilus]THG91913.1 malate:quinone oxidoreductase [Alkalihalobacillus alcalophilus ATCC 27647 = CGMCC 1.3604]